MERSKIVIFASSRSDGNTRAAVRLALSDIKHEFIDLATKQISLFDYQHANLGDDFLSVVEEMITYDDIILATPVYWYAASAQMKIFLDRWSDLLTIRKDLGVQLAGKRLFVICSYATDFPLGTASFEVPMQMMCDYMNMNYGGCFYYFSEQPPTIEAEKLKVFQKNLQSTALVENKIQGKKISLRMAVLEDRKNLYTWMYESDASKSMWGAPLFPEKPIKLWEDFKNSWALFYYQNPLASCGHVFVIEYEGEDVGGIAFHKPDVKNRSEIDIWLRSEKDCGKGIGKDAIDTLCKHIYQQFGILFFWAMPSARNPRSVGTFQKVGFKPLPLTPETAKLEFGGQDYIDSIYLLRDMSSNSPSS